MVDNMLKYGCCLAWKCYLELQFIHCTLWNS